MWVLSDIFVFFCSIGLISKPVYGTTIQPVPTCVVGSHSYQTCDWSDWSPWDCSSCCGTPASTVRTRHLCCSVALRSEPVRCFSYCGYVYGVDNKKYANCQTECSCPAPSTTTPVTQPSTVARACVNGTQTVNACDFSDWSPWDCTTCCQNGGYGASASRFRDLCCSGSFDPLSPQQCYTSCQRDITSDPYENRLCLSVCSCPTTTTTSPTTDSTTSAATSTTSSRAITTTTSPTTTTTSPTTTSTPSAATSTTGTTSSRAMTTTTSPTTTTTSQTTTSTTSAATSTAATSTITTTPSRAMTTTTPPLVCSCPTTSAPAPSLTTTMTHLSLTTSATTALLTILSTKTPLQTQTSNQVNTASTTNAADSSLTLCYEAEEDIYHCGPQCEGSENWDDCVRSCSKDLYMTLCKLVSASLFVLGVIVGTLVTSLVKYILAKRQRALSRAVSPESVGSPDDRLTPKDAFVEDFVDEKEGLKDGNGKNNNDVTCISEW